MCPDEKRITSIIAPGDLMSVSADCQEAPPMRELCFQENDSSARKVHY